VLGVLQSSQDVVDRVAHLFFVAHVILWLASTVTITAAVNATNILIRSPFLKIAAPAARQQCQRVIDHRTAQCRRRSVPPRVL